MSSFDGRSHIYLFELKNGKKKLGYGTSVDDALGVLAQRLSPAEMSEIVEGSAKEIHQREVQSHVKELG